MAQMQWVCSYGTKEREKKNRSRTCLLRTWREETITILLFYLWGDFFYFLEISLFLFVIFFLKKRKKTSATFFCFETKKTKRSKLTKKQHRSFSTQNLRGKRLKKAIKKSDKRSDSNVFLVWNSIHNQTFRKIYGSWKNENFSSLLTT